jgi:hypothetical protein
LTTTAAGLAETATSGDYIIGKAMDSGVSGDIISMLITRWGVTT